MDFFLKAKKALESNNFKCHIFEDRQQARLFVLDSIPAGKTIGIGGSMTIEKDLDLFADLAQKGVFLNQYEQGLTPEQSLEVRKRSLGADFFLTSTNAITLEGELVNTDGTGNRIAALALAYGPRKVFVIAGKNKIVENRAKAFERIRNIAAPLNAKRLGRETGCEQTGYCIDCKSSVRICCNTMITSWQNNDRIEVILINEDLGY